MEYLHSKKKRIIKKIVYQEASSDDSDSDDADEVEVIKVKKDKTKKKENQPEPEPEPPKKPSYTNLLYESSVDKLKSRMMDERARNLILSVMPNYG